MPVAPREKSIRPELRLEFKARAATIVKVTDLMKIMMFLVVAAASPNLTKRVSPAE